MNLKKFIIKKLDIKKEIKSADIIKATGLSRAYVNRVFQQLEEEGLAVAVGKANQARYVKPIKSAIIQAKKKILSIHRHLINKNLSEDIVLDQIKKDTGIFLGVSKNVSSILDYAFTKMLNNAVEHSQSSTIDVLMKKEGQNINFEIIDRGIGIYKNIMKKRNLKSELEAIQDLLKGKQTTAPKQHTGEGIFFTSKAADLLIIQSSNKKLIFNNIINDIFIKDGKKTIGTRVVFTISAISKRKLEKIFKEYTDDSFEFSKTKVVVKLFKMGTEYISRSQARRILSGLEKFKTIILDFKGLEMIGQGFADEVFRIWQTHHPKIKIIPKNAVPNISFMIKHSLTDLSS
jgi:hypothetical protein